MSLTEKLKDVFQLFKAVQFFDSVFSNTFIFFQVTFCMIQVICLFFPFCNVS